MNAARKASCLYFSLLLSLPFGVILGLIVLHILSIALAALGGFVGLGVAALFVMPGTVGLFAFFVGFCLYKGTRSFIQSLRIAPVAPAYLDQWSWASFFLWLVWPVLNKLYGWALLSLVPGLNVYIWLRLCFEGRQLAWKKSQKSLEEFIQFQQKIKKYAPFLFILVLFLGTLYLLAFNTVISSALNILDYLESENPLYNL